MNMQGCRTTVALAGILQAGNAVAEERWNNISADPLRFTLPAMTVVVTVSAGKEGAKVGIELA